MIKIIKQTNKILLSYEPELVSDPYWLAYKLKIMERQNDEFLKPYLNDNDSTHIFNRTFKVSESKLTNKEHIINDSSDNDYLTYLFILAVRKGDYYKFDKDILMVEYDLFIHKDIRIEKRFFTQFNNISIFGKIGNVIKDTKLIIGGEEADLPFETFLSLIDKFPNSYELHKYSYARIAAVLENDIKNIDNFTEKYEHYLNKKLTNYNASKSFNITKLAQNEIAKYQTGIDELISMYNNYTSYSEKDWQNRIVKLFRLINPKYIKAIEEIRIKDYLSNSKRIIDIVLIDASGYIDIVEIKKPNAGNLLSKNKYRNNYLPTHKVQEAVMQTENYLLSLHKEGDSVEKRLNEKYKLKDDLKIRIVNPKAFIIMGLENNMNEKEKNDFEIVKKMYSNIVDIISYDELIRRFQNIMESYQESFIIVDK